MNGDIGIGKTIGSEERGRDAIHIAVVPVVAQESLNPGDRVRLVKNKASSDIYVLRAGYLSPVGIVDPFLANGVKAGDKFYLFLFPGSITSLRHEWIHPAFAPVAQAPTGQPETSPAASAPELSSEQKASQRWIDNFACMINQSYDDLMAAARQWALSGEYTYDNTESYKGFYDKFEEFWEHYEIVTKTRVENKNSFYTCAC